MQQIVTINRVIANLMLIVSPLMKGSVNRRALRLASGTPFKEEQACCQYAYVYHTALEYF